MRNYITLGLKGFAMGAANVIPGVSGGTIALIVGIFEELIHSLKSCNLAAIKLLFTGKFKEFAKAINLGFLIAVFVGAFLSIGTLAIVLEYLFINYPIFIWAFFFGLIVASVVFVGKTISKWNAPVILSFIIGTGIAITISLLNPAVANDATWYLVLCGVVAVCSMILPGLSGSFILILMGNYELVMIDAVKGMNVSILIPVAAGAVVGLIAFSHVLSWLFKKFKDQTISLLTGFILGSLAILWPWKNSFDINGNIMNINNVGAFLDEQGAQIIEKVKVSSYQQILPELDSSFIIAVGFMVIGFVSIYLIERFANTQSRS